MVGKEKWKDYVDDFTYYNWEDDEPCQIQIAYENYKKHYGYYPSGVMMVCYCKKCKPIYHRRLI